MEPDTQHYPSVLIAVDNSSTHPIFVNFQSEKTHIKHIVKPNTTFGQFHAHNDNQKPARDDGNTFDIECKFIFFTTTLEANCTHYETSSTLSIPLPIKQEIVERTLLDKISMQCILGPAQQSLSYYLKINIDTNTKD